MADGKRSVPFLLLLLLHLLLLLCSFNRLIVAVYPLTRKARTTEWGKT
jgi:hypothetical protein